MKEKTGRNRLYAALEADDEQNDRREDLIAKIVRAELAAKTGEVRH